MAQMIEPVAHKEEVRAFYDSLSVDYDLMTEFRKRFVRERPFFHMLVDRYHVRRALDAGAGTGFHSLLLAQLGVDVTAVDISPLMIRELHNNAASQGLKVTALVAGFGEIPERTGHSFDAVFCLGNSLAHATSKEELQTWLRGFSAVLRPGGLLFAQTLNYDRILADRNKTQNVRVAGKKTFLRFYEYAGDHVVFHLRTSEQTANGIEQRERSISLLPLRRADLLEELEAAGFTGLRTYGTVSLEAFTAKTSRDLFILGTAGREPKPMSLPNR